ncbi:hypothetical protein [Methanobrevibacter sp.]|uniref:hypothetical protein n=1 Tax=Methanobrevibacter sp. TaxID=66852 RepID=UPI0025D42AF0|nr:hypothetical protein [Methanobrevibacter sp.]MBQ2832586.1 hypothetical protein [Methanobrevibacter sp.]
MDWNTIVQNIDLWRGLISTIFSAGIYKIIDAYLNNLHIPNDWDTFKKSYESKLEKIIGANLEEISKNLEEIIDHTKENQGNDDDEESFNLIEAHKIFFLGIIDSIRFRTFEREIKLFYMDLVSLKNKITSLFAVLFVFCIICVSVSFFNSLITYVLIIIIVYLCFELVKVYLKFRKVVSEISNKIEIIDENYNNVLSFGEKYGN